MIPGRRNPLFTEDGIRAAIKGNLEQIEAGISPAVRHRAPYQPYRKHGKYTGIMALYVHYLYLLGKIGKREYPPRMTTELRQAAAQFDRFQEQFAFLREHDLASGAEVKVCREQLEQTLADLTKQRTMLNVRKKKRKEVYEALADTVLLAPAYQLYTEGFSGMESEAGRYQAAVQVLDACGVSWEQLRHEKAVLYDQLARGEPRDPAG